jgi:hypothetical protein
VNRIPKFKSEDDERDYWAHHSPLEHLPQLPEEDTITASGRPPKIQISLRIRPDLKEGIEQLAAQRDIPYQTMIHSWIMERYYAELSATDPAPASPQLVALVNRLVESRVAEIEARLRKALQPAPAMPRSPVPRRPTKKASRS